MSTPLVPSQLLDSVVAHFRPQRVIVFGSVARGEAGPDSDIDLLVVVDDDTPKIGILRLLHTRKRDQRFLQQVLPRLCKIFRTRLMIEILKFKIFKKKSTATGVSIRKR